MRAVVKYLGLKVTPVNSSETIGKTQSDCMSSNETFEMMQSHFIDW